MKLLILIGAALLLTACSSAASSPDAIEDDSEIIPIPSGIAPPIVMPVDPRTPFPITLGFDIYAQITDVAAFGEPGAYRFNVTIESTDTGCDQYADWWEVLSVEEELLYRRVLLHSHVDEQPFTRSGGPMNIQSNETVVIRAHMNTSGNQKFAFVGTVNNGFSRTVLPDGFASDAENQPPLPGGCAF